MWTNPLNESKALRHAGCGKLSQIKGKGVGSQLTGPCRDTETIGGDHRCKPDADHRPDSQEEVQRSAVIEGCGLEEQSTALAVSSHDVVDGSMTLLRAQRLERPTAALGYPIHERLSSDQ